MVPRITLWAFLGVVEITVHERLIVAGVALIVTYILLDRFVERRYRDSQGRFQSQRRGQLYDVLKVGALVGIIWFTLSVAPVL